ncbi:MAG: hypothetical protein A2103_05325 [Gammaproteobacteria bacterium GWF2_41_13]|nr:MAG: hypothetical protein A2103_05325 [Gammaproteobacteria bacterium GWF2_41_13]
MISKNKFRALMTLSALTCASLAFGADTGSTATLEQLQQQVNKLQAQVTALKTQRSATTSKGQKTSAAAQQSELTGFTDIYGHLRNFSNSVVIQPFTSKPTYYSGGQLVVNAPGINEDEKLLYRRALNESQQTTDEQGGSPVPRLVLSGDVEGKAFYTRPYHGPRTTDLNLTGAELDAFAEISQWVNGFATFEYDNSYNAAGTRRVSNSNVRLGKGFLTLGNLTKSPVFGSLGQMNVPFGRYSSFMISDPLTQTLAKTKARALSLSYIAWNPAANIITPYAHVFGFKGDAKYGNSNMVNQYGGDLGFWLGNDTWNVDSGVSYMADMADATGMQETGRTDVAFQGFDQAGSNEKMIRGVPAFDWHNTFTYDQYNVVMEYVTAMRAFSPLNATYNGRGAKPSAVDLEGAYNFKLFTLPTYFAVGVQGSKDALVFNVPRVRYIAALSSTVLTNTILTLEYRHDVNYGSHDTATGAGAIAYNTAELGKSDNAAIAKIGVYF